MSIITDVQEVLKKQDISNSQFYQDYKKTESMYKDLLDKGVVSKRQSQLLSISDLSELTPVRFNYTENSMAL